MSAKLAVTSSATTAAGDGLAHALDCGRLPPLGREAGRAGLDDEPCPPRLLHVAEVAAGNRRAAVRHELDEPLADEASERFAERRPRDAELVGERLLPQTRPRRELARDDPLEELGVDLVDDAPDLELPCVLHGAATSRSASSSGQRERDVKRVRRHRRLLADGLELAVELDDGVLEAPDSVDLDRDDVARLDGPRVGRRPRQEHVARLERDQAGDVGDLVREREEQVASRVALLHELAVHVRANGQVVGIDVVGVDEGGPERAEAILSLDAQHRAPVGVAEVVDAPVVGDGVTGDVAESVADRRPEAALADDDRDLALVVEESAPAGPRDGRTVRGDASSAA